MKNKGNAQLSVSATVWHLGDPDRADLISPLSRMFQPAMVAQFNYIVFSPNRLRFILLLFVCSR